MQTRKLTLLILLLFFGRLSAACTGGGGENREPQPAAVFSQSGDATPTLKATATATRPTATPTAVVPTATFTPEPPTATPTQPPPTPTPSPTPPPVNGLAVGEFIVMPDAVRQNVRDIFQLGQTMGRNPRAFSKLGDSTTLNPNFLGRFDDSTAYVLGEYAYLQPTIDHFAGSYGRYGVSARHGLHSWSIFDPMWANEKWCEPNEHVIACEIRLHNPGILFIRLGSNDAGAPAGFDYNIREAVQFAVDNGVVPVIVTKADRFEGPDNTNNNLLRQIAADFRVPMLDFDLVAGTLPDRGLDDDGIHMAELEGPHDFTQPATMESGHAVHDLAALMMLDALREEMVGGRP